MKRYIKTDDDIEFVNAQEESPYKKLLRAVLRRAIIDAVNSKEEDKHFMVVPASRTKWAKIVEEFFESGLGQKEFAEKRGIKAARLYYYTRGSSVRRLMEREKLTGAEYIFADERDESEPFSFSWVLYHLFPDVEEAKKLIRKLTTKKMQRGSRCQETY